MYFKADAKVSDESYLSTYNVMRIGDIAFEGNRSGDFAHGRFVENDIGDGIVSHVFKVFRPVCDYDLSYWKYAINNESVMGPILTRSTKASTMMHELVPKDFLSESIRVPPTMTEQRLIGALFRDVDDLITLRQRELKLNTQQGASSTRHWLPTKMNASITYRRTSVFSISLIFASSSAISFLSCSSKRRTSSRSISSSSSNVSTYRGILRL